MKTAIIIPARMESKRFPGKPLHMIAGKTLLEWTYQKALTAGAHAVYVATEDIQIVNKCLDKGMNVSWPVVDCRNGTQRCAKAITTTDFLGDYGSFINWQVDEPDIHTNDAKAFVAMATGLSLWTMVGRALPGPADLHQNSNQVKVIASHGVCHWFSRQWMPYSQLHIGLYGFHKPMLRTLGKIEEDTLFALRENLEQLTWIEKGFTIRSCQALANRNPISINTIQDALQFEEKMKHEQKIQSSY